MGCAGVAGFDCAGVDLMSERTDPEEDEPTREAKIDRVIEVNMKIIADQVVAFDSAVAAPRGPKAV